MPLSKKKLYYAKKTGATVNHYFSDFCGNTSIGGFKYLGEQRTASEKTWWIVVIILSFCASIYLISGTYTKWRSSPVIVSFATSQTDISDVSFPAISICTDVKARSKLFKYSEIEDKFFKGQNVSEEELKKYHYMDLVCDGRPVIAKNGTDVDPRDALQFITEVAPRVEDVIESIRWQGTVYTNTSNFFTPVLTSEGVCFTYNLLDRKDIFTKEVKHYKDFFHNGNTTSWNVRQGYSGTSNKAYPRFSVVSGTAGGVDLVLTVSKDDVDYSCTPDFLGFKISLLHPAQIPRGRKNYFTLPLNQVVLGNVKPVILKTSDELRSYTPEDRKCYFGRERKLMFYKTYNQANCLLECLTNYTRERCGCVGFHMPQVNSTPICAYQSRQCMESAKALYLLPEKDGSQSYSEKCHCLPTCSSLDYEVEISQSSWNWQTAYRQEYNATTGIYKSRLKIFFKYMQFITSVRNELYGTTDFLASCGGILGLFIGFSAVSIFEIIYYLTLRLFCNVRLYKERKRLRSKTTLPQGAFDTPEAPNNIGRIHFIK